jgi:hypothetical protein
MKQIETIEIIGAIAIFILVAIGSFCIGLTMFNRYDVNRDGKVTAQDYIAIKNYIMEE